MGLARIFGGKVGAVTLVEAPVSRTYAQKARLALYVGGGAGAVLSLLVSFVDDRPVWLALLLAVLVGVVVGGALAVLVTVWPVLRALWWWSVEITAVLAVLLPSTWLAGVTSGWLSLLLVLVAAVGCWAVRPVRARVVAWSWCVIVRHRLRLCFARVVRAAGPATPGALPLILWARPTPAGERVWVWLRPGLDLGALEGKSGPLAVACWASEVRVVRASSRYAALVRVDLSRRDPLAVEVVSPLADLFSGMPGPVAPAESGHAEAWALDLDDVAAPAQPDPPRGRR